MKVPSSEISHAPWKEIPALDKKMTEQTPATTYCANHPQRETMLRCNRCDKLICTECAVLTPTGYRCKECVREQQKVFDSAIWYDYLLGFGIAFFLSLVASLIFAGIGMFTGFLGFILAVFGGPFAGVAIGESVRFIIKRRRARSLFMTIFVAVILGALPAVIYFLYFFLTFHVYLYPLIVQGLYLFTAAPTVYYRVSGFKLGKK
jgi:hypothetical protein